MLGRSNQLAILSKVKWAAQHYEKQLYLVLNVYTLLAALIILHESLLALSIGFIVAILLQHLSSFHHFSY